jgi:PAS domain S-box-containing protein
MRISSYTQILVLICLGAALASFLILKLKFDQFELASTRLHVLQTSKNDINVTQTMLQQWYTTIDLYFADHQTYLAKGMTSQTQQILKRLALIEKSTPDKEPILQLQQRISVEARRIQQIAFAPSATEQQWSELLKASDSNTQQISLLYENVRAMTDAQFDHARQEQQRESRLLKLLGIFLLVAYIITVILAAYFTSRTIIKPLERLTELVRQNPSLEQIDALQISHGPKEIKLLAASFQTLCQQISAKMDETLASRTTARRAQQRLKELVDNVSLAIITIDINGQITSFNPATSTLFNRHPKQLENLQITELLPSLNIQGGLFRQMLNAGVDIELDANVGENVKPVELSCAEFQYQDEHCNIHQYTLILHDISNRKWNEDRVKQLNQRLINTSRQAGIAEIATSILHSVGNVLNSVNTSVSMLQQRIENEKVDGISKTAQMFEQQGNQLFSADGKGPQLVAYLYALNEQLEQNKQKSLKEVASLKQNVLHIAEIVSAQQKFSGKAGVFETIDVSELIEEALNINVVSLENNQIEVIKAFKSPLTIKGDRSKIIQILVNLIRNANEAMMSADNAPAKIIIAAEIDSQQLHISVQDNGQGIEKENLINMFCYGFTTKEDGHGFGLHSCALAAKEMDGSLTVHSDGPGTGALFSLSLPTDTLDRLPEPFEQLMSLKPENNNEQS